MSVEPAAAPSSGPAAPPPVFHAGLTLVAAVLVVGLAVFALWPTPPLDLLERPEESLAQLVGREMELRETLRAGPAWERRLYTLLDGSDADALADAIAWYDELVEAGASPLAELHRVILVAEEGRPGAVDPLLDGWGPGDDWALRLQGWARLAYGREPADAGALRAALLGVAERLGASWFADRLTARLARRLGDHEAASRADAAVRARGARTLAFHGALVLGQALLVVLGVAVLGAPGRSWAGAGSALLPPPWGAADGVALFTRGALGLLGPGALAPLFPDTAWTRGLVSVASLAPLLLCLWAYGRRRAVSAVAAFGLAPARAARGPLLRATVGLVGLSTLADLVVETAGGQVGWAPHWTDGFQETLVWGSVDRVLTDVLDSVVIAPVVEELLFRGVLYGTLRRWLAPWPAALLSAALFALAHGYGAVGFAAVFTSGLLWAAAYERTRSLLPSMLAHAAGNLLATLIVLLTLRF